MLKNHKFLISIISSALFFLITMPLFADFWKYCHDLGSRCNQSNSGCTDARYVLDYPACRIECYSHFYCYWGKQSRTTRISCGAGAASSGGGGAGGGEEVGPPEDLAVI